VRGYGAPRNQGLRHAGGDFVVFLDGDARPARPDFVAEVVGTFGRYPEAGVVGGPLLPDPEGANAVGVAEHMVAFPYWHGGRQEGVAPVFQPGANLAARRQAVREVGEFRLDIPTLEDMEWQDRLLAGGRWKVLFNPRAVVYHATRRRITGAMRHIYGYGCGYRPVYMTLRPQARWPFQDDPRLFALNLPRFILRRFRMVLGQWLRADPRQCAPLIPWILFFSGVWAWGVARGGRAFLKGRANDQAKLRAP
jgi:GT2 family glycosyltransferase